MKKFYGTIILLGALFAATPVRAQLQFGVEGGLNLTKADFSENMLKSDNRAGWFIGPKVQLSIPVINISVDGALLYSQKDLKQKAEATAVGVTATTSSTKTLKSIQIPINARYTFGLGEMLGLYVATGPEFGYNVGGRKWNTSLGNYKLKDSFMSWNIGAGLMILSHLQLGLDYNFPIGKSGENKTLADYKDIDFKTKTLQVQATYFF
jgi:opacity protein-like surface antigen